MNEPPEAAAIATWGAPPAEVAVDAARVHQLLREQAPQWSELPVKHLAEGWDNVMFRLGDTLLVRLPRRQVAVPLVLNEQRWLPQLAPHLPLAAPAPVFCGQPGCGYPWPWSVLPWLPGDTVDITPPGPGAGRDLAAFLIALHQPAPADAPANPVRGVPITERAHALGKRLARLRSHNDPITPALEAAWYAALAAPVSHERRWLHGDLHPSNVLVKDGVLSAAIDWGDMTAGDVATDLSAIWLLLEDPAERAAAQAACAPPDDPVWVRARGWAFMLGAVHLDSGRRDSQTHATIGANALRRLDDDLGNT